MVLRAVALLGAAAASAFARSMRSAAAAADAARPRAATARRPSAGWRPALEVLVDPARQHRDLAVAEQRPDRVGDPLEEVAVVGDHDERAGPAVEEVLEDVEGLDVEVVGGLVEQQHVGLGRAAAAAAGTGAARRRTGRRAAR